MRLNKVILTTVAFLCAAALSFLMAAFIGQALEDRTSRHVKRALTAVGMDWVEVSADGLTATLRGTAPTEAMRYRAASVAASVVSGSRVNDELEVTPPSRITAPRFSLEFLRNDDGISVIGLVPASWESDGLVSAAKSLTGDTSLTNMLETADFPIPPAWEEAISYGLVALKLLPRSKISLAVDGIKVTAISDSPAQKRRFEDDLARVKPKNIPVTVEISAPRPVIAPFTLRFLKDTVGPRFDACAADSERSRNRIVAAAQKAGMSSAPACTLGLGAPSPRWAEAAEAAIAAVGELGSAVVTISDVDVSLIANPDVSQADFDRVVGDLTAKLPDVFSLKSTLLTPPAADLSGIAQFTATRSSEGAMQLRGRLTDESERSVVEAYTKARFGSDGLYVAARMDENLPPAWGMRVLTGLSALAELDHGSLLVQPGRMIVKGVTGNQGARAEISRQLSERLGQGADFSVDVTYDERLDPLRGLPTPEECLAQAKAVLDKKQIAFAPNKAEITAGTAGVVNELVEALKECREVALEIGGHTDSQGRAESNLRLSQQRAEAVLTALSKRGIDTSEMVAKGYGAAEPIADNKTEAGRLLNRRIEFKLIPSAPTRSVEDVVNEALAAEGQAEDDGEATPEQHMITDEEIAAAEGAEPMGEAGDMLTDEEIAAATAVAGEVPDAEAAPDTEAPAATTESPDAAVEAPQATAPEADEAIGTEVEGTEATEPATEGATAEPTPSATTTEASPPAAAASDAAPQTAVQPTQQPEIIEAPKPDSKWQETTENSSKRPKPRPEESRR